MNSGRKAFVLCCFIGELENTGDDTLGKVHNYHPLFIQ